MPKYTYQCSGCEHQRDFILSISEFQSLNLKSHFEDLFCNECQNKTLVRKVSSPFGKIERRKEEIVERAKEEARIITNKIREGDQRAIRDIFGEEKK